METDDLDAMMAINQDPKVMEYFPGLQDKKQTLEFINRVKQHHLKYGYSLYAVELKESHEMIGFVGLNQATFEAHFTPAIEIGWRIASEHWNKGYATEAAIAVLDFAFNTIKLDSLVSFTVKDNEQSRRVMEKIGMHYDSKADFDHPKLDKSSPLSKHVLYRLTREAFNCENKQRR